MMMMMKTAEGRQPRMVASPEFSDVINSYGRRR